MLNKQMLLDQMREKREDLGLSYEALAETVGLGCGGSVQRYERRGMSLRRENVEKLLRALNFTEEEIAASQQVF